MQTEKMRNLINQLEGLLETAEMNESVMVAIPKESFDLAGIKKGDILQFSTDGVRIIIEAVRDIEPYVCDGNCDGCPAGETDCDGECQTCMCRLYCEDSEVLNDE